MDYLQKCAKLRKITGWSKEELEATIRRINVEQYFNMLFKEMIVNNLLDDNGFDVYHLTSELLKKFLLFQEGGLTENKIFKQFPKLTHKHLKAMEQNVELYRVKNLWFAYPMDDFKMPIDKKEGYTYNEKGECRWCGKMSVEDLDDQGVCDVCWSPPKKSKPKETVVKAGIKKKPSRLMKEKKHHIKKKGQKVNPKQKTLF